MRTIGVMRKIGELGRIVLPKEFREVIGIKELDSLYVTAFDTGVFLEIESAALKRKKLGIQRKVDELGRVCLPKNFRRELDIKDYDNVYMHCYSNGIFVEVENHLIGKSTFDVETGVSHE